MEKKIKPDSELSPLEILAKYKINAQQELFCQYWTSPTEFYGSGVESYLAAYHKDPSNKKDRATAYVQASALLTNLKVLARIDSLLSLDGFNDQNIDKELLFIIKQSKDFGSKLGAIREYNKLKARVTERIEHSMTAPIEIIEIIPVPDRPKKEEQKQNNDGEHNTTEHSDSVAGGTGGAEAGESKA